MSLLITTLLVAALATSDVAPPGSRRSFADESQSDRSESRRISKEVGRIFPQVYRHWRLRCEEPGFIQARFQFDVTLDAHGRIVSGPTLVNPRNGVDWRSWAEEARAALIAASPFDVPEGYRGGAYRPTFIAAQACVTD